MQDASKPIWFKKEETKPSTDSFNFNNVKLLVATPVHSDVSIHYTESLLTLQGLGHSLGLTIDFLLLRSSLVTQGRNLCVANFLNKKEYTHMLFVDGDISFDPSLVIKLIKFNLDVLAIPYPMKSLNWKKIHGNFKEGIDAETLSRSGFTYPIKIENEESINVNKGIMEVTHAPTGFMLIKKEAILKMIEKYPHLKIKQPTIMNGEAKDTDNLWNFFDTWFDQSTNKYYGEDFAFCQKWRDIGGKCYCYIDDFITHVGEYSYVGKFIEELVNTRKIDESNKNK